MPLAMAVAWQQQFENSPEPERPKLVAALCAGTVDGVKSIGFGQRVCGLDKPSTVATVEQYRYPTQYETKDGFASPTSFEVTNLGCTMTLKVTTGAGERLFAAETDIRDVALLTTQHHAASKTDQPGSIEQPVFASQSLATSVQPPPGCPSWSAPYLPHKDDAAPRRCG